MISIKTKSIGIRLPNKLWDLIKAAEPNKNYSEIIRCALEEKYSFNVKNKHNFSGLFKIDLDTKSKHSYVSSEVDKL